MENTHPIRVLHQQLEDKDGKELEAVSFVIDGKLKEMMDAFMQMKPGKWQDYPQVMADVLFRGVEITMKEIKGDMDNWEANQGKSN